MGGARRGAAATAAQVVGVPGDSLVEVTAKPAPSAAISSGRAPEPGGRAEVRGANGDKIEEDKEISPPAPAFDISKWIPDEDVRRYEQEFRGLRSAYGAYSSLFSSQVSGPFVGTLLTRIADLHEWNTSVIALSNGLRITFAAGWRWQQRKIPCAFFGGGGNHTTPRVGWSNCLPLADYSVT